MRYFTSPAERDLALEAWNHARALARVSGSVGARVTDGEPGQEVTVAWHRRDTKASTGRHVAAMVGGGQ
ncbi:hypothetical protein HOT45_gp34 [Gordonia phage Trine]|uniref:Uncharacterized protein n=1 Tax=Gordonia phage Trine TaxID=2201431 RepID=A0A2Z4Q8W7_9CAUD|nr:hypothetical protein HOT45_gp34 [Gordonia phage Trine]AWY06536.1 hypothetical protein PBI_TRINE_34 [Gordonia phage Trine]